MLRSLDKKITPQGNSDREAIDSLRGYVYQIYQSALAWLELKPDEFLFLEVAEDYAVVACNSLKGVQVKETAHSVTINSDDIIASINSYVELSQKNPELKVEMRHLTTSIIGKERSKEHRIGSTPTLNKWRELAKAGDVEPLRSILYNSKLSKKTVCYIRDLSGDEFRENFLKRIHFDCGAPDSKFILRLLRSKLLGQIKERGGVNSQVETCLNSILMTLLHKATQKEERFVDRSELETLFEKATQIPINRAQFELQNNLINKLLNAAVPQNNNIVSTRLAEPKSIYEVPFPSAIASRSIVMGSIISALIEHGLCWIFGAAGVGKTIGAKMAARHIGGEWAGINLKTLNANEVDAVLSAAINRLADQKISGFLIDDIECSLEPFIVDTILYFRTICQQKDVLLIFTSNKNLSSDFLFSANLSPSITQKIEEFSENDIAEILTLMGVNISYWTKYIYTVSGGGHPQLAIAAIQSMQKKDWDLNELSTLDSLRIGNPEIEKIRSQTRARLLNELPEGARRILERLSLKPGSFQRDFVLDMAQIEPIISDGGILFEQLIGSWVDQHEMDRFSLSPLLSNFAAKTLSDGQRRIIHFEIANSLLKKKGGVLDPIEANSALIAAWAGKNTQIVVHLCLAVILADHDQLEMISPHLIMFTYMKTDTFAYEDDLNANLLFRGAQLLIVSQNEDKIKHFGKVLLRFEQEIEYTEDPVSKAMLSLLVYAKLLLSTPKFGALPKFWELIHKLDVLLKNENKILPSELMIETLFGEQDNIPVIGFMFLFQAKQIHQIKDLVSVFQFIDSCDQELRMKILKPFDDPDFGVDMLVVGAWLTEHHKGTIDAPIHSKIFSQLEEYAKAWGHTDLAVCCRKHQVIIVDEYGKNKEVALEIIDQGFEIYGETNSELVRAKAKVLYRAEDHRESLELSKLLIEGDAPLSETEKAFLGRDAAISAEKQGEYEIARRYYLYGSRAAKKCDIPSMVPMYVGLKADAALASWHSGDRETCLRDFVSILNEINDIDSKSSLRAAHCHAICRHVLLWLDQDITGEKRLLENGEETKIYPGVVSNPEPHPEIANRFLTPIEMAWYMLGIVENHCCLDVGITKKISTLLPRGPIFEGQFLITPSKMKKALILCDFPQFAESLCDTIAVFSYIKAQGNFQNSFNIKKVRYGLIPDPTAEQKAELCELTEQHVLCFASNCIFTDNFSSLDLLLNNIETITGIKIRTHFMDSFKGRGQAEDYYAAFAMLLSIHRGTVYNNRAATPSQIFELVIKALQVASQTNNQITMAKNAFKWIEIKWAFIQKHQRFLLKCPAFYEKLIEQKLIAEDGPWQTRLIDLMQAILPTLGYSNEAELSRILNSLK